MLTEFLRTGDEAALYQASQLSQTFIESGMGPEDIVAMHSDGISARFEAKPPNQRSIACLQELVDCILQRWARKTDDATTIVASG